VLSLGVFFQLLSACGEVVEVGLDDEAALSGGTSVAGGGGGGSGGSLQLGGFGDDGSGDRAGAAQGQSGASPCQKTTCRGRTYKCGNCDDDDHDGKIDSEDPDCLGPCDDDEQNLRTGLTVGNAMNCRQDCYFDGDAGPGNDKCEWNHQCDTLSVAPDYPPSGEARCAFDPSKAATCAAYKAEQPPECKSVCYPLVPNGCDCFGCCALPGVSYTVWLGSENPSGTGSCNLNTLNDPTKCKPCTQVAACLNTCEHCEICVGKPELPPDCVSQQCPSGRQACGQPGQADCPAGYSCITGCCIPNPP